MSKICLTAIQHIKQGQKTSTLFAPAAKSESTPVSEQSRKGPGNRKIPRSESTCSAGNAEQSGEGPGNGWLARSANGKEGTKRKLDQKTLEDGSIMEIEKDKNQKKEIGKMFGIPKTMLTRGIKKTVYQR